MIMLTGDWQIDYLTGGPIDMYIGDTADVRVYSMQDGTVCNVPHLIGKYTLLVLPLKITLIEFNK